jgi:hypothetical protein
MSRLVRASWQSLAGTAPPLAAGAPISVLVRQALNQAGRPWSLPLSPDPRIFSRKSHIPTRASHVSWPSIAVCVEPILEADARNGGNTEVAEAREH